MRLARAPRARDIPREHAHKIRRAVVPSDPLCVAHVHSRLSSRSIDIEHESDVRDAIAYGERIQALDHLAIQFACRSLIHSRGIRETICDHAHATFERGLDYLAHELAATSLKQKQLSSRVSCLSYAEQIAKGREYFRRSACRRVPASGHVGRRIAEYAPPVCRLVWTFRFLLILRT